jgi:hypothetical protein
LTASATLATSTTGTEEKATTEGMGRATRSEEGARAAEAETASTNLEQPSSRQQRLEDRAKFKREQRVRQRRESRRESRLGLWNA